MRAPEPEAMVDRLRQAARHERVAAAVHLVDHPLEFVEQLLNRPALERRGHRVSGQELLLALRVADLHAASAIASTCALVRVGMPSSSIQAVCRHLNDGITSPEMRLSASVGAEGNLSHRADGILSRGGRPTR